MKVRKHQNVKKESQDFSLEYMEETKREKAMTDASRRAAHKVLLFFPMTLYMKIWEIITTFALVMACVMTPWGLAFEIKGDSE